MSGVGRRRRRVAGRRTLLPATARLQFAVALTMLRSLRSAVIATRAAFGIVYKSLVFVIECNKWCGLLESSS